MLHFDLSPQQKELQAKVRDFALREILPAVWHYDEKDEIPLFLLEKAFAAGFMNCDIPAKYGGAGLGIIEDAIVTEEIAAACPGVATSISDNSLGAAPIVLCDNEPLKERILPLIARRFRRICFATSEPLMGSDVAGMRCKAEKSGDDYVLNGTKYWITNAAVADYMTVFATIDPDRQHEGIGAFLVEKDWKGVSVGRAIPKLGQRCSNTAGLHFANVRVPKDNVIAEPGKGFVLAMRTFSRTRPVIGAFAVGAARSAMEYAIDYAKKRKAFGTRLSNFEAVQFKIAEMYQKVETARLLVWKAAWEADNGIDPTTSASIAKFYATEAAMEVAHEALQIFGGYGYTRMYPLEKLLRDIRLFSIYEGTSEVQRLIVSGYVLNGYKPVMPPLEDLPMLRGLDLNDPTGAKTPAWRCRICGHIHYGEEPPEECPSCFFPKSAFKKVWPAA
ncbi:MAG: Acyl-CoA dehydrogenase [Syntrophaceae bacterium PtaU1.Bin231]|nr:MAG: Acyl-CoA dehydrogenase [Syntrophaceae bacterium PtaU1.Bin231]HOG15919.1 acyl-CoA dehydrogenase family protein [Syntrophales bacterium]